MIIDNNLTYEKFMELSKNPPQWEGETLFKLTIITIDRWQRRRYPKYGVCEYSHSFYHTREEAEQFMRQNTTGKDEFGSRIFCYYLHEYPYATILNVHKDYLSCRVYDEYGRMIEQSLCADIGFDNKCRMFFGRPAEKVRFKEGDIVEILDIYNSKVSLGVVIYLPMSPEKIWRIYTKLDMDSGFYALDASDDTYTFIYGSSYEHDYDHIAPIYFFTPHFKIPDKIRQRFENYYKNFLIKQESYEKEQ